MAPVALVPVARAQIIRIKVSKYIQSHKIHMYGQHKHHDLAHFIHHNSIYILYILLYMFKFRMLLYLSHFPLLPLPFLFIFQFLVQVVHCNRMYHVAVEHQIRMIMAHRQYSHINSFMNISIWFISTKQNMMLIMMDIQKRKLKISIEREIYHIRHIYTYSYQFMAS